MKTFFTGLIFLLLTINVSSSPLHSKLYHDIIIDSDCSESDLRAISLLLSHSGFNVKAIIISDGAVPAEKGMVKIMKLLKSFGIDTIPVGYGLSSDLLLKTINAATEQLTIISLGPLSNIANALKDNQHLYKTIEEIIWYNNSVLPLKGFNYDYDRKSSDFVLETGIRIDIVSTMNSEHALFDKNLVRHCRNSKSRLAKILYNIPGLSSSAEKPGQEELAAIYMSNPELFEMTCSEERSNINYNKNQSIQAIKEVISDMLSGTYKWGHSVALNGFPVNRELYLYDVRLIMDSAISQYGKDEWKACVLTDEFHGHLGVYSIVGAKMGILAREYFNVETDQLEVETFAGFTPPFSCMNDGLQVSTGATLGQGTIHLAKDTILKPQAIFKYNGKSILIKLKPAYVKQLVAVIEKGVSNYGLADERYWTLVRQTSLRFWLEWNRNEIFELSVI